MGRFILPAAAYHVAPSIIAANIIPQSEQLPECIDLIVTDRHYHR